MSKGRRARLFLDSNVLTGGIVARWGLIKQFFLCVHLVSADWCWQKLYVMKSKRTYFCTLAHLIQNSKSATRRLLAFD